MSANINAEIYRCTDSSGMIEFTDDACPGIGNKILNISERYNSPVQGLRPYELERLRQLEENLRLEKMARYDARQVYTRLTMNDEVQCVSAMRHLDEYQYRYANGHIGNSQFIRELYAAELRKLDRYCR